MANAVKEITADGFDQAISSASTPVVVDFWAPWCLPCHLMASSLEEVAAKLAGRVEFLKLNVDEAPQIADRYGIRGIPTLILFVGGKEVDRHVGFASPAQLEQWLAQAVSV